MLPVLTQDPVSALQLEGVFAAAEVVDEVAELVDVLQALGHDHLLVDQVGLRQVGAVLGGAMTRTNTEHRGEESPLRPLTLHTPPLTPVTFTVPVSFLTWCHLVQFVFLFEPDL